ncbi:MAG: hypothetical protein ACKVU4_06300 [Phycisphaerales bacterium]
MPASPTCPRCGYDQSGVIATWGNATACPLEGTCSECGLSILWRDLLNPQWTVPRWSFEHRAGWWQVGAHLRTCWAALRPWSFWTRMNLHFPIVRSRLLRHAAAMLLACHLAFAVAAAYQCWSPGLVYALWVAAGLPPRLLDTRWLAIDAFLWPYHPVSILSSPIPMGRPPSLPDHAAWFAMWVLLTPFAFVVLTETFRRKRLRVAHLLRGFAYSLTPLPIWTVLWVTLISLYEYGANSGRFFDDAFDRSAHTLFFAAVASHVVSCWWFVRRYLRVPHAEAVTVAMTVIAGLAAGILVVLWRIAEMTLAM